ncbi:general substrate transporter [Blastocladiella britannica]|nr:general substrate transporter [Blastocladiella britannica]
MTTSTSNAYLYYCAAAASIGFFHFGYHLGELNNISTVLPCLTVTLDDPSLKSFLGLPACIPMSTTQFSFASALIALAGAFGALVGGNLAMTKGRRTTILLFNIPMLAGALLLLFMSNYTMLVFGRLFSGIGTGGMLAVVPIYISEISPNHLRGRTGIFSTIALSSGLAAAGTLGYFFYQPPSWRIITGFTIITTVLQVITMFFAVESPVFLQSAGRKAEAHAVLTRMGCPIEEQEEKEEQVTGKAAEHHADDQADVAATAAAVVTVASTEEAGPTVVQFITEQKYRPSLIVLLLSHITQQASGINVYFSYSFRILSLVFSPEGAALFYVFFSYYNILINLIPAFLLDRYGRRPLMLFSTFSMAFFAAMFAFFVEVVNSPWVALVAFVGAATVFALGLSSIPFILTAEVVEPNAVGPAAQVSLVANNLTNFVILFVFPIILDAIGAWTFLILTGYLVIAGFVSLRVLPETKGKSPQEVVAALRA